jgi:hypothetical protein
MYAAAESWLSSKLQAEKLFTSMVQFLPISEAFCGYEETDKEETV